MSVAYDNAMRQAASLRLAAGDCSANQTKVQAQIDAVSSCLEGAAARALISKLNAWKAENAALREALLAAASSMESGAAAVRQAEIAAARAAEERAAAQKAAAQKAAQARAKVDRRK